MAIRTIPNAARAEEATFNQLTVERFRADRALGLGHSNSRNNRVVEVLCYLSLLSRAGKIQPTASVTYSAAERQQFKSPGGYQAAHFLPCQVFVSGRFPWLFIQDGPTRSNLECLFGDVEHLPANFNKADSAAEAKGLKEAFRQACQAAINDPQPKPGGGFNRELVRRAYSNIWSPQAATAFQAAMDQKDTRPHPPELQRDREGNLLNLAARSQAADGQWRIEDQLRILQYYAESLQTHPPALADYRMDQLEKSFQP